MGETVNSVSSLGFRLNTLTCSCVNVQRCGGLSRPRRSGTLPSPPHGCMCATILSPHPPPTPQIFSPFVSLMHAHVTPPE